MMWSMEPSLLQAVLDNPDDRGTRFVLSDFLEENGVLRPEDRPQWLRLNGYWTFERDGSLWWSVLPRGVSIKVAQSSAPVGFRPCRGEPRRPNCQDCEEAPAWIRWPTWADWRKRRQGGKFLGKRWLCGSCHEQRVADGSIRT